MTNITSLTSTQLNQIIAIKQKIEALQGQIESIAGGGGEIPIPSAEEAAAPARRKYHMTAAHKRKLIKALVRARKIRWAKVKGKAKGNSKPARMKYRRASPALRAKLSAAAKARWARVKAEGKKTL